jgi:hypothetical protein
MKIPNAAVWCGRIHLCGGSSAPGRRRRSGSRAIELLAQGQPIYYTGSR